MTEIDDGGHPAPSLRPPPKCNGVRGYFPTYLGKSIFDRWIVEVSKVY